MQSYFTSEKAWTCLNDTHIDIKVNLVLHENNFFSLLREMIIIFVYQRGQHTLKYVLDKMLMMFYFHDSMSHAL